MSRLSCVDRLNSEGIRRRDLLVALKDRRQVTGARFINSCLLCRRPNVNLAGLCDICYSSLEDGPELRLAERLLRGEFP